MNTLKIGTRLTVGFGFLLALIALLAGVGLWHINAVSHSQITEAMQSQNDMAQLLVIILASTALLTGIALSIVITRSIVRPLSNAVQLAQTVASRDLTAQINAHGHDETGALLRALQTMTDSLRGVISDVQGSTYEITTASNHIMAGNNDLLSRTEEQASSLAQTASTMEQLTTTVRQNADNAQQANTLATTAAEVATRGGHIVSQVVTTMDSINDSSKKVEAIIGVIDGIAFQTNILALNAAVESARAGEAGRGFAVVASEVRSLAQRSAQAANEIKALITASVTAAATGNRLVGETGVTMTEIVEAIQRVTDIMGEITAASQEQTGGIEQVNEALIQMDQTTRQNATVVEDATAAASSLQAQSRHLEKLISTFKIPTELASAKKYQRTAIKSDATSHKTKAPHAVSHSKGKDNNRSPDSKSVAGLTGPRNTRPQASVAAPSVSTTRRTPASVVAIGSFQTSAGSTEEWEEF